MNNLKRVLSLALSGIMLVGMMAIGASAADFVDADEIVHNDAVNILVALNVINGKDDGSHFDPTGDVTRAEMAKMIAVAMNGGTDANTGVKGTPSFTDIKGHWAESYIEYCYDLGIISGRGDGTFDPGANVTGLEATKMVLTALGYDATAYRLTGAAWAVRTDELARKADPSLYDELSGVVMATPASRDVAAQLIWNGLQNTTRRVTPSTNTSTGEVTWSYGSGQMMLKERYDAEIMIGTFTGNDKTNDSAEAGQIVVTRFYYDEESKKDTSTPYYIPSDLDISFIGEEVKVIFKDGKKSMYNGRPDKNDTIFGVFVTGNTQVVHTTRGNVKDNKADEAKIKIGDTKYALGDTVNVYTNYVDTSKGADFSSAELKGSDKENSDLTKALKDEKDGGLNGASGDAIKLLLDDGKVTKVYITESKLAKVTAKNSTQITLSDGLGTIKLADNDVYEDVAKNDIVVVTHLYKTKAGEGFYTVEKAEVVNGTISAYKAVVDSKDKSKEISTESITVDGTSYTVYGKASMAELKDDAVSQIEKKHIGEEFDLYLVNGYVGAAVQVSEGLSNYSLVTSVTAGDGTVGDVLNGVKIQVLGSDGVKTILTLKKDSVDKVDLTEGKPTKIDGTADKTAQGKLAIGDIVTYSVDKNGEATVEKVGKMGTAADEAYVSKTKAFDGMTVASGAVLFADIDEDGGNFKAYDLRSLGDISNAALKDKDLTVVDDGTEIVAVYANLGFKPSGATTTTVYGIVSAYNGTVKVDGTAYRSYVVDANDEQHVVYTTVLEGNAKGTLVELDLTNDNVYTSTELKVVSDKGGYVAKYSERDNTVTVGAKTVLNKDGKTYKIEGDTEVFAIGSDTKVYFVDQNDDKGVVSTISEFDPISNTKNIIVIDENDDKTADVVIFEVSNKKDIND